MQSREERLAADARLKPFGERVGFLFGGITAAVTASFLAVVLIASFILTTQHGQTAMSVDFRVYWAVGQLALMGEPLSAFDAARLGAIHATYTDAYVPWLYPPGFMVIMTPFGAFPFAVAFTLWTLVSLALVAWAIQPFVFGIKPLWIALSLAPAFYPALLLGQNSLLLLAGLLAALSALRSERWILAGIFIGCLTLKPQLGVMIPFALLAIRAWQTIFAAIGTTIIITVLPTLAYGIDYWPLLQTSLAEHSARMVSTMDVLKWMISPMYTFYTLGMDAQTALKVQMGISVCCAAAIYALWRSDRVGFDVKAAGLLLAIMLSAPYLWSYEGALMAAIALFMLRGGILTTHPAHLALLGFLWIGAALQALNIFAKVLDPKMIGALVIPPVLFFCFALCLRQIFKTQAQELKPA
jgi:arabinofuranan 3-O-arabinosyltransferase